MSKPTPGTTAHQQAQSFKVGSIHKHILLCAGPECTDPARGEAAWNYLKRRIVELRLDRAPTHVFRTKCHCLRMCTQGPIAVVQPDNTWYHSADPSVLERILQEHILGGCPVEDHLCAQQSLPPA